jgi:hypothetical protein
MNRRFTKLVALFLTLAQVFQGGLGRGSVLCFEADGRVVLETEAFLCCGRVSENSPSSSPSITALDQNTTNCRACVDVSLPLAAGRRATSHVVRSNLAWTPSVVLCSTCPFASVHSVRSPRTDPGNERLLNEVAATVLRI